MKLLEVDLKAADDSGVATAADQFCTHILERNLLQAEYALARFDKAVFTLANKTVQSDQLGWEDYVNFQKSRLFCSAACLLLARVKKLFPEARKLSQFAALAYHAALHYALPRRDLALHSHSWRACFAYVAFEAAQMLNVLRNAHDSIFWRNVRSLLIATEKNANLYFVVFANSATDSDGSELSQLFRYPDISDVRLDQVLDEWSWTDVSDVVEYKKNSLDFVLWTRLQLWDKRLHDSTADLFIGKLFPDLAFCPTDLQSCAVETLSQLDIELFIHLCTQCTRGRKVNTCLPFPLCDFLAVEQQRRWWHAVVDLLSNTGGSEQRHIVKHGLEVLRLLSPSTMEPRMILQGARLFQRMLAKVADAIEGGNGGSFDQQRKESLQRVAAKFWKALFLSLSSPSNGVSKPDSLFCSHEPNWSPLERRNVLMEAKKYCSSCASEGIEQTSPTANSWLFNSAVSDASLLDRSFVRPKSVASLNASLRDDEEFHAGIGSNKLRLNDLLNASFAGTPSSHHNQPHHESQLCVQQQLLSMPPQQEDIIRTLTDCNKMLLTSNSEQTRLLTDTCREIQSSQDGMSLQITALQKQLDGLPKVLQESMRQIMLDVLPSQTSAAATVPRPDMDILNRRLDEMQGKMTELMALMNALLVRDESLQQQQLQWLLRFLNGGMINFNNQPVPLINPMHLQQQLLQQYQGQRFIPPPSLPGTIHASSAMPRASLLGTPQPLFPNINNSQLFDYGDSPSSLVPQAPPQQLPHPHQIQMPVAASNINSTKPAFEFKGSTFSQPPLQNQQKPEEANKAAADGNFAGFQFVPGFRFVADGSANQDSSTQQQPTIKQERGFGQLNNASTSVDFASSAQQFSTGGFGKSTDFKGFSGAGTQVFGAEKAAPVEDSHDKGDTEEYEPNVHFAPVCALPALIEHKTGEEEEKVLFCERAKLFRFDPEAKVFKERGVGELKILESEDGQRKRRIVMRREQVLKLCANHYFDEAMHLSPMEKSDRAYTWKANDYSEEELNLETLAAKFRNADSAHRFKEIFDESVERCRRASAASAAGQPALPAVESQLGAEPKKAGWGDQFKPAPGSWACKNCYARNTAESDSCVCCQSDRQGNPPAQTTFKSGALFSRPAATASPSLSFDSASKDSPAQQQPTIKQERVFGQLNNASTSVDFASLAQQFSTGGFGKSTDFKGFSGAGTQVFGAEKAAPVEDSHDKDATEEYEPNVHFAPVCPLPALIEHKTGEEEEKVLFCERAKLFRFDPEAKVFKERGVGELKILESEDGQRKRRIVMRREQVLKLCANHYFDEAMHLSPMEKSDRAYTWKANDYSEEELNLETLAAKFRNANSAHRFKEIFDESVERCRRASAASAAGQPALPAVKSQLGAESKHSSWGEQFKPAPGSWACKNCYARNTAESNSCVCCQSDRQGNPPAQAPFKSGLLFSQPAAAATPSSGGFSFGFGQSGSSPAANSTPKLPSTSSATSALNSFSFSLDGNKAVSAGSSPLLSANVSASSDQGVVAANDNSSVWSASNFSAATNNFNQSALFGNNKNNKASAATHSAPSAFDCAGTPLTGNEFASSPENRSFFSPLSNFGVTTPNFNFKSADSSSTSTFGTPFAVNNRSADFGSEKAEVVDLQVIYPDKQLTVEQQQNIREFKLPPNFYSYQDKPPCPGCVGCSDDDDDKE